MSRRAHSVPGSDRGWQDYVALPHTTLPPEALANITRPRGPPGGGSPQAPTAPAGFNPFGTISKDPYRKVRKEEEQDLVNRAIRYQEKEQRDEPPPVELTSKLRKLIEVPFTEEVEVPMNKKVLTRTTEKKIITGMQLMPVKKYKEVQETRVEVKQEVIKGTKEVWVKKQVPFEKIVKKPVKVNVVRRVPYTDYEEKPVTKVIEIPCDKLQVKSGHRTDQVMKTKLYEVEQDRVFKGDQMVREGTPRMRQVEGGQTHGVTKRGNPIFEEAPRMFTGPDRHHGEASMPATPSVRSDAGSVKQWNIRLHKPSDEAFGMRFDASDGSTIKVDKVKPGQLMDNWNNDNPDRTVRRGDRIVEVNGMRGSAKQLMDLCSKGGPLNIKVQGRRPQTPGLSYSYSAPTSLHSEYGAFHD